MTAPLTDLGELLKHLRPELHPGAVAFCSLPPDDAQSNVDQMTMPWIGLFREVEGLTIVVSEEIAIERGWTIVFRAAWITLTVHSDLAAVGLTAAVTHALATAGISCNVIAAINHDHLFVPVDQGERALSVLQGLHG